jgi:branched-chain amino acid transport system permease protein
MPSLDFFLPNFLNSIVFGFILFNLSIGFSLILGVMGILNLAHGAIYMIGAYVGWTVAVQFGLNFFWGIMAGGLCAGLVGVGLQQGFLRYLHMQIFEQILLTAGFIFILTNLVQWIFGPIPKVPYTPPFMVGFIRMWDVTYPLFRFRIIIFGIISYILFWWIQDHTRIGAVVRAGMDDKEMTMGLGINLGLVSALLFFFGMFITGSAGVVGMQLMGIDLALSLSTLKYALVVSVIGGVGSVHGVFLGSMLIGLADTFGKALFPQLAMFTIFLALIIILLFRPVGLLGRKGMWG